MGRQACLRDSLALSRLREKERNWAQQRRGGRVYMRLSTNRAVRRRGEARHGGGGGWKEANQEAERDDLRCSVLEMPPAPRKQRRGHVFHSRRLYKRGNWNGGERNTAIWKGAAKKASYRRVIFLRKELEEDRRWNELRGLGLRSSRSSCSKKGGQRILGRDTLGGAH